ncbi:GNAT family N-acetyltransferase [Rhizobium sp. RM]|uniref:GNAT family N-acetyltransferase n=1 Tax=Rhizobium sp. RM TaxID=2748079 RepID=UPI00110D88B6|nr:GNAT family N-acetyltransferase [Rhizobium sp. RM]NWJ23847.1 GNAT family N-acetyltransferase [Rhizobium sp. RM]TMV19665.1 GNAT family N-acetyltransferase [Rhizobium sp. Td3]
MHDSAVNLPLVRRLEAVSFRAWPASSVIYDGSWQIRLTGSHPSKRINSVVPLDPSDYGNCAIRLERARKRFEDFGRPLVVRETTLMPPQLADFLIEDGWNVFEEVKVMTADISALELPETLVSLPSHDIGRFVEASLKVSCGDPALRPAVAEIVSSIKPTLGLFINEEVEGSPLATAICVQDNDLAGILSLDVASGHRRSGLGTQMLASALRWARISGARTAWLQVVSTNAPAIALYEKFGFTQAYTYRYWQKAGDK